MSSVSVTLLSPVAVIGRSFLALLEELGRIAIFFVTGLVRMVTPPFKFVRILQMTSFIGTKSLFVVALTGMFAGMVLGLQGYYTLVKFGAEASLGLAVALTLIRELGPVLTALMVTGRAGSSMAAEIGVMRISEQIDALDTMDIDPVKFLFSPRLAGAIISFPLLTALFDVIGIIGGYLTGVVLLGVNSGSFLSRMKDGVLMEDVTGGFIKAFFFALIVATVSCYKGYHVHRQREGFGARGVSLATTQAVVLSSVLILVFDYVLTSFLL